MTEETLLAFMRRKEPLKSCTICQAYSQGVAWGQANSREATAYEGQVQRALHQGPYGLRRPGTLARPPSHR